MAVGKGPSEGSGRCFGRNYQACLLRNKQGLNLLQINKYKILPT